MCALLVGVHCWWVHTVGGCILLVCAHYWCVRTIGVCTVAEAAPAVLKWSGQEVDGAMSSGGCG